MEEIFLGLAKDYGPVGILALYLGWRDFKKGVRITQLERWTRRVLLKELQKSTAAIQKTNVLMERLETLLKPSSNGQHE